MKDNKEFIDGVYKKYEEYQDGNKFKKVTVYLDYITTLY
jgi:hypothetical protein